ncbi:hypothetical protein EV356DRAFT_531985 [Viridothelium virens]|uniref:Uncharacterized protein n=1 Tax=Viridothelium virens TaxID=1048519 RepID=A0A6A6HCN1_VIRVR|nr:hypothetical protein EV356DRAFT_531985 [Viridothelium virens]
MRIPSEAQFGGEFLGKRQDPPPQTTSSPSSSPSPSPSSTPSPTTTTPSPSPTSSPSSSSHSTSSKTVAIVVSIAAALLVVNIIVFFYLRKIRRRNAPRRSTQTHWLKEKWQRWNPKAHFGKGGYSSSLQHSELSSTTAQAEEASRSASQDTNRRSGVVNNVETAQRASVASTNVGRNTSLRSIMTLPAYTPSVRPDEQILGREGERGGIDTVLEFPETVDEEEARREEEMESLYQIRLQRRRENGAREERRRARREARARGDLDEVNRLRRESRLQADTFDPTSAAAMIIEHQTRGRDRRVSSVSYAGAGVARADGTRIRATSAESSSDRNPLLSSAASMGSEGTGGSATASAVAVAARSSPYQHARGASETSVLSQTTTRTTAASTAVTDDPRHDDDYEVLTLAPTRTRASSMAPSTTTGGSDLGESRIPLVDPPEYENMGFEDAPPYESPIDPRRRSLLPRIEHLPAIEVTLGSPVEHLAHGHEITETEGQREQAQSQR